MKTIFKDGIYERVDNEVGEVRTKFQGWKFVSKSEWKKNVRDIKTVSKAVEETKKEETLSKKAERHLKLKEKQRQ